MSVVGLRKSKDAQGGAVSGSGMDREVESRAWPLKTKIATGAGLALLAALLFWWLIPHGNRQSVAASHVTISSVTRGTFEDYIPLRAKVTPLLTVYIDAIEGGRVEKVLVEDGTNLAQGQPIATLSNAELQLSTLARTSEVTQQLNNMRSQELALAESQLSNERAILESDLARSKAERQFQREQALAQNGFVSASQFKDTQDAVAYERHRAQVLRQTQETDNRLRQSQLAQLRRSATTLQSSLGIARGNLDALNLRAPVAGQLSGFSIQIGESLQPGQRIGQIDSPGRNKLVAPVDEYYLGRVALGQTATVETGGKRYRAKIAKIYPQVQNGNFQVDLQFVGGEPAEIQRGQTLQVKLTLGDPTPAVMVPNGAFYNDSGGAWVFVVAPDGKSAVKRTVRLGRRNTDTIEVLDGLTPDERIITSPYTGLTDKDRLDLTND